MKLPLLWRKIQTGNCNWEAQASDPSMWQSAVKTFSWCIRKIKNQTMMWNTLSVTYLTYPGLILPPLCKHQGRRWCCCHAYFLFFSFVFLCWYFRILSKFPNPLEKRGWKWTLWGSNGLIKAQLKKLKPRWASTRAWKDCRLAAFPRSLHRQVKFSWTLQKQHPEEHCADYLA